MLTFHLITLFPEAVASYLEASILGRAQKRKLLKIHYYNPRAYAPEVNQTGYRRVDSRPYGGGPGMVLLAEPILRATAAAKKRAKGPTKIFIFSPAGQMFDNALAEKLAKPKNKIKDLILICGRYEGLDARVRKILNATELSIGPYVLSGGEVPALAVVDAIARRLPGVLGQDRSVEERRVAASEVYARPEVLIVVGKKYRVPKVLLSGHHAQIEAWRQKKNGRQSDKQIK
ncbi:MAG: tRNA (guanosine(37)-N1)-methyltransferase TrmD [Candidatus Vogelbacteria bacterium CG10_big_fil_rev_8_21_14_0_10_49_38]|uniref:tRNA (guanine-N(1)-)-methyltransferase n=1 Tax=Candidatus Vogelbacteria bacterium CG10_big_fil_rev_8_21_14_0_10_49_38 TaxID=1975043 RepID=A0A2H0RHP7_9BACT|nr:MAG: tRNA (guanosine(37)-N1)-methyltransferase TrmD [bacterium CG10_49_38]PIR46059.1 MAG: tRNA (guanosine(37)-N1)-methyltransferase TrmD [Candidatus Vogelbacteria bacterium CG10_big_fil_rev_8_21_14_0_10_49_38]